METVRTFRSLVLRVVFASALGAMGTGCASGTLGFFNAESPSTGPAGVPGSGGTGAAGSLGSGGTMGGTSMEAARESSGSGAGTTAPGADERNMASLGPNAVGVTTTTSATTR